jgi:hypothetical protein
VIARAPDACTCGCRDARGDRVHAIARALAEDDLDQAIELGLLLDPPLACANCDAGCRQLIHVAREARLYALAARERFRARNARLERRAHERAEQRTPPAPATQATTAPALPSAAAAALARARAKAAARHKP